MAFTRVARPPVTEYLRICPALRRFQMELPPSGNGDPPCQPGQNGLRKDLPSSRWPVSHTRYHEFSSNRVIVDRKTSSGRLSSQVCDHFCLDEIDARAFASS